MADSRSPSCIMFSHNSVESPPPSANLPPRLRGAPSLGINQEGLPVSLAMYQLRYGASMCSKNLRAPLLNLGYFPTKVRKVAKNLPLRLRGAPSLGINREGVPVSLAANQVRYGASMCSKSLRSRSTTCPSASIPWIFV